MLESGRVDGMVLWTGGALSWVGVPMSRVDVRRGQLEESVGSGNFERVQSSGQNPEPGSQGLPGHLGLRLQ